MLDRQDWYGTVDTVHCGIEINLLGNYCTRSCIRNLAKDLRQGNGITAVHRIQYTHTGQARKAHTPTDDVSVVK